MMLLPKAHDDNIRTGKNHNKIVVMMLFTQVTSLIFIVISIINNEKISSDNIHTKTVHKRI